MPARQTTETPRTNPNFGRGARSDRDCCREDRGGILLAFVHEAENPSETLVLRPHERAPILRLYEGADTLLLFFTFQAFRSANPGFVGPRN
jgi:hypothetical protein